MIDMIALSDYREPLDLLGVVTFLQLADASDEERVSVLHGWCDEVGRPFEDWMEAAVIGPPIGVFGPGEMEV